MEALKEKIRRQGRVIGDEILKVDSFLNHQVDVPFLMEIGQAFAQRFAGERVDRILTAETSGIAIAVLAAPAFHNVPVVFAKKTASRNMDLTYYESRSKSYTRGQSGSLRVSKAYLPAGERVLILDDFLAEGNALLALADMVKQAGSTLVGAGIVIEKAFQPGGQKVRDAGIRLESLVRIQAMEHGEVVFQ